METVIRGTTPEIVLSELDQDLSTWTVYVTFEWDVSINHERIAGQITKTPTEVTSTTVSVNLTQADTLSFPEKGNNCGELPIVKVQIKAYKNGKVIATDGDNPAAAFYVGSAFLESTLPLEG